jgi:hypothetical protein
MYEEVSLENNVVFNDNKKEKSNLETYTNYIVIILFVIIIVKLRSKFIKR